MELKDLLIQYRSEHGLSQRQFAAMCGLSNGYISMIEKGENPKTHLPVVPTIPALKKLATGMAMSLGDLLSAADDMPVLLADDSTATETAPTSPQEDGRMKEFIDLFGQLTADQQALIIAQIKGILSVQ